MAKFEIQKNIPMPTMMSNRREAVPAVSGAVNAWTWTLSMPRSVRATLNINGPVEKRDIARLIKQLNALKEAFDEDETESSEDEGAAQ